MSNEFVSVCHSDLEDMVLENGIESVLTSLQKIAVDMGESVEGAALQQTYWFTVAAILQITINKLSNNS